MKSAILSMESQLSVSKAKTAYYYKYLRGVATALHIPTQFHVYSLFWCYVMVVDAPLTSILKLYTCFLDMEN